MDDVYMMQKLDKPRTKPAITMVSCDRLENALVSCCHRLSQNQERAQALVREILSFSHVRSREDPSRLIDVDWDNLRTHYTIVARSDELLPSNGEQEREWPPSKASPLPLRCARMAHWQVLRCRFPARSLALFFRECHRAFPDFLHDVYVNLHPQGLDEHLFNDGPADRLYRSVLDDFHDAQWNHTQHPREPRWTFEFHRFANQFPGFVSLSLRSRLPSVARRTTRQVHMHGAIGINRMLRFMERFHDPTSAQFFDLVYARNNPEPDLMFYLCLDDTTPSVIWAWRRTGGDIRNDPERLDTSERVSVHRFSR